MNDEFLYALRRPPSPDFSRRLKRQLQLQASRRARRFSTVRTLLTLLLFGGSALAGAYWAMNGRSTDGDEEPSRPLAVAEQRPALNPLQTSGPSMTTGTAGAAPGVDENNSAHRHDSNAAAQASATRGSAPSGGLEADAGAIRSGSTATVSSSSNERAAPRLGVVTSSLADPLTKAVVDAFWRGLRVNVPVDIRTEKAASAFRALCAKSAAQPIDIVVASRRITDAELENCRRDGVPNVLEFKIGYQAVVLAGGTTSAPIKLSTRLIHLALAKQVPDPAQPTSLIDNPTLSWDQLEPTLDSRTIEVLGPTHGTQLRRVFETLVLGPGCDDTHTGIQAKQGTDPERYAEVCYFMRTDGLYQEVEQTTTMVSQNLWADPHAIAVVDYNFYRAQRAHLAGSVLAGVEPTETTLADGTYPLARPVYVYASPDKARGDRALMGARLFWEFERASAPWGYLLRSGLTPIDAQERKAQYERQQSLLRGPWARPRGPDLE